MRRLSVELIALVIMVAYEMVGFTLASAFQSTSIFNDVTGSEERWPLLADWYGVAPCCDSDVRAEGVENSLTGLPLRDCTREAGCELGRLWYW